MRLFHPVVTAYAHCDLPCGVYDPAQARIEAESVKAICLKYADNTDPVYRTRCIQIKEERSELVKHHLWVLWTDYFKPPHFEKYPQLHDLFNRATKAAGAAGGKGSVDPAEGQQLLDLIAEIDTIFWETKKDEANAAARTPASPVTSDLASIVTDDPTKQGNPGKPQSVYQRSAAHLNGPDKATESAPL